MPARQAPLAHGRFLARRRHVTFAMGRLDAAGQVQLNAKRMLRSSQGLRVMGALEEIRSMPVPA